ncbi:ABC transporter permease [Anaerocolumna xylanovorans]|uniref:ABC-2 type transport system permease protein n=1 Tax=Anaerocolumna xylanovorans DSM 12503 TaxID=1121345 RepID=A0A1M7Y6Z3_9FIRM|nr:ABC transporter permease [Anaerocolumna xylanovorans]SHO48417.1 ABC-2 type transport system permease protein [Anaerocolumna xylanovorans DSM 12503]
MEILIMIKKQLKLLFSNRLIIFAGIAVPVILTYLFSNSISSSEKPCLYVADLSKSFYSRQLLQMITSHKDITVVNTSRAEILKKVDDQLIPMGLVIDKGFDNALLNNKPLPAEIIKNFESADSAVLKQVLNTELSILKKIVSDSSFLSKELNVPVNSLTTKLFDGIENTSAAEINNNAADTRALKQETMIQTLLGFLVMFIWFAITQGFRTLIEERENNTYYRLLSTPASYNRYLAAKIAAAYLFGAFHILAVLLVGKYFLKLPVFSHLLPAILIFAVYIFLLCGISLPLALFMKRHEDFTVTFAVIIIATGILGGSFFSLETAPRYLVLLSKFTPESWGQKLLEAVLFHNSSIASQLGPLLSLMGIALLCMTAAFTVFSIAFRRKAAN